MKKRDYSVEQIAEGLAKSCGIITEAARIIGCDRQTVYNYLKRYPELEQIRDQGEEVAKDVAEARLLDLINMWNLGAICFFLKCKGKDRGYVERQENIFMARDGVPVEIVVKWGDQDGFERDG